MIHRVFTTLVSTLFILAIAVSSSGAQRIVTVVTLHGIGAWHSGCILGGSHIWRLLPHTGGPGILTDLILGFPEYSRPPEQELPPIQGQGSILELAHDEDWSTAFFSSQDSSLNTTFSRIRDQVDLYTAIEPGYRNWGRMNEMHGVWLATDIRDRFSWIHLSLTDLPPGGGGSAELYRFWFELHETLDALSDDWALFVVFIPTDCTTPWSSSSMPLGSFRGTVVVPPENIVLSTLDIAPSLAHVMRFINTPDYVGQSLSVWERIRRRIEPLSIRIDNTAGVQGTRILAFLEGAGEEEPDNRVRFYDLWARRFISGNHEMTECAHLSGLLSATEQFNDQMKGFVSAVQGTGEENSEE